MAIHCFTDLQHNVVVPRAGHLAGARIAARGILRSHRQSSLHAVSRRSSLLAAHKALSCPVTLSEGFCLTDTEGMPLRKGELIHA